MPARARGARHQGSALAWFGVLGGGIAWSLHLLASYLVAESICVAPAPGFELLGIEGGYLLLFAITLVTGLVALAAVLVGAAQWSKWRSDEEHRPAAYLSLTGLILSATFLVIILVEGVPPLFLEVCGP